MSIRKLTKPYLAIAVALASLTTATLQADPPTAVADMTKKELKIHKRNVSEYTFETQGEIDRSTGFYWIQSPQTFEELTPSIQQYFRVGYKDSTLLTVQLIVIYNKYDIGIYDKETMDFHKFELNGLAVPATPQRGIPANNAVTLTTSVKLNKNHLTQYKDTGLYLKGISKDETIEVPVRPALVAAILKAMDKYEAKMAKKKKK